MWKYFELALDKVIITNYNLGREVIIAFLEGEVMKNTFGGRLSALLQEKGIQQQELAKHAGVTEAAVSHYVNGTRVPRSSVLARIAAALGTSSDYLISGDPGNAEGESEMNQLKRMIARNASQMSREEKMEIISILMGPD